jgi:hypothetical protein
MSVFPSTESRVVVTLLKKTGRGHLKFFASLLKAVSVLLWRGNYKGLVHPLADF